MLVCFLLCGALALGMLVFGAWSFKSPARSYQKQYQQADFASTLYEKSYMLYWKLQQKNRDDFTLTPTDVFFPEYRESAGRELGILPENYATDEAYRQALEAQLPGEDALNQQFSDQLLAYMNSLSQDFDSQWNGTGYLALDLETGSYLGTWNDDLAALAKNEAAGDVLTSLQSSHDYYAVLRFGDTGALGVPTVYGATQDTMDALQTTNIEAWLLNNSGYGYDGAHPMGPMRPPHSMAVVFPVPTGMVANFYADMSDYDMAHMRTSGLGTVYYLALLLAMGTAALLWLRPGSRLKQNPAARLAPELSLLGFFAALGFYEHGFEYNLMRLFRGDYVSALAERGLPGPVGFVLSYGFFAAALGAIFLVGMVSAASAMQIKELGFKEYLRQRSLCLWFWRRFSTQIKALYHWVVDIDLSDKSNRFILKILVANFLILAVLCSAWFFGIAGLVVYTVILYFILQSYAQKLKHNYAKLLDATGQMAEGRLDVHIDKDLGVFTPLGQELVKVQQGFTVAVREQTKSQRMKTELISNVSHDLKTPLTAIITYVNLLKQENVTDEERRSYVATLDAKSQRLKSLIEDLFEMSKASSGNIVLHPTKVDLPALVRQVELEASDALNAANIEFRYNFPPGKIELLLDGEKTSRIFENMIMNVAKYGMPGTRAYVTIVAGEKLVTLEMKNVSKNELSFDSAEITERFMRGDTARSTDGSGLGLAIAKSFAEAQGAQFKVVTDGDMFKAYLTFSRIAGVPVPRAASAAPQPLLPGQDAAVAGFVAPSSNNFKTPFAAFSTQAPAAGPVGQPTYPAGYPTGSYPTGGQGQPPQSPGFTQMTLNQMADAAANVANNAVNAVANVARQAADKAKMAGKATKEEAMAAKMALQQARFEAKEIGRRLRKEAKEARKNAKRGGTYPYPGGYPGQGGYPAQDSYPPHSPAQQAAPFAPPGLYAQTHAPAYNPPPAPPAEVLYPEQLFRDIPTPPESPPIEPPALYLPKDDPLAQAPPDVSTPDLNPHDTAPYGLTPHLELYPMPELLVPDSPPAGTEIPEAPEAPPADTNITPGTPPPSL